MILTAGKWIFEETVKTCARWHAAGAPPFTASVNLSCLQIEDSDFLNFMEETLRQYRIPASMMEVELTESYIASNIETLAESFRRIRRMGLSIAMDDFGTGYSSLGILKLSRRMWSRSTGPLSKEFSPAPSMRRLSALSSSCAMTWESAYVWKGWKPRRNTPSSGLCAGLYSGLLFWPSDACGGF